MGDFPSGQRGQTVNLLAMPSVVRIHHLPPSKRDTFRVSFLLGGERIALGGEPPKVVTSKQPERCDNLSGL